VSYSLYMFRMSIIGGIGTYLGFRYFDSFDEWPCNRKISSHRPGYADYIMSINQISPESNDDNLRGIQNGSSGDNYNTNASDMIDVTNDVDIDTSTAKTATVANLLSSTLQRMSSSRGERDALPLSPSPSPIPHHDIHDTTVPYKKLDSPDRNDNSSSNDTP
jgi:hypothetical protein